MKDLGKRCENGLCGRGKFKTLQLTTMSLRLSVCLPTRMWFLVFFRLILLTLMFPLTDTECMCFLCGPQRFASQMEESFRYERRTQITPKDGKDMLQSQGRSPLVRGSGMSASERMMEPCSLAGGPKWTKRPGTGLGVVEGFGRYLRISQPNMRYNSGRGQIQVGLIFNRDGYASCTFTRRRRTTHFLGNRVNKRR